MEEKQFDNVTHPSHYCEGRQYEPRKVIEDWNLNFYLGNALKYISRAGRKKSAEEDLKKAKQYIDFELERLALAAIRNENEDLETSELFLEGKSIGSFFVKQPTMTNPFRENSGSCQCNCE